MKQINQSVLVSDRPPLQSIGTMAARITLLAVSHPYSDRAVAI
ncbi:hypothetical protein [Trichocoleus desertorum]